jgi:hypothetical protein
LNAITNLALFVAAWLLWRHARSTRNLTGSVILLVTLLVAFGIGSTLFHTFATPATRVLDVLPIALFMFAYLWFYLREILHFGRLPTSLSLLMFVTAVYIARQFPHVLNGSLFYAPALATLVGLWVLHYRQGRAEAGKLLWAIVALSH